MVQLLVERGADLNALTEGDAPFTLARLKGHDHICDLLRPLMDQAQTKDSHVWARVRIAYLEREIARLKASLS